MNRKICRFLSCTKLNEWFLSFPPEIGDTDLSRKISLCNELIHVAETIEPGSGLFRGKLLVDLQEALTVQTERQFTDKTISAVVALVSYLYLRFIWF